LHLLNCFGFVHWDQGEFFAPDNNRFIIIFDVYFGDWHNICGGTSISPPVIMFSFITIYLPLQFV